MSDDPGTQFADLAPFLSRWALPTENERSAARWNADAEAFQAFYDAVIARLDELLATVDRFELGAIPDAVLPYYHLLLAFAEAAPHCELYGGSNRVPNSFAAERFVAAHGDVCDG